MQVEHDADANAIYIRLSDAAYHHGDDLDPDRRVDFAVDGSAIGIELLNVSEGVDLRGLPEKGTLAERLAELGIRILSRSH